MMADTTSSKRFRVTLLRVMSVQVMQFLKEWLANHILTRDLEYAKEISA